MKLLGPLSRTSRLNLLSAALAPFLVFGAPTSSVAAPFVVEPLGQPRVGDGLSIAVDANNNPHILYGKGGDYNGSFRHTYKLAGQWHYDLVVDRQPNYTSSVFNSGTLYTSYQDVGDVACRLAQFDGSNWLTEPVPPLFPVEGLYTSVAVDRLGRPHIAYFEDSGGDNAIHAVRALGGNWTVEDADGYGTSQLRGLYTSLAISPFDTLFISHVGSVAGQMRVRLCELFGSWQCIEVNPPGSSIFANPTAVVVNALGRPLVAFYADLSGSIRNVLILAERTSFTTWNYVYVDTLPSSSDLALKLDGLGQPHFAYRKGNAYRHAYIDALDGLQRETVDVDPVNSTAGTGLDLAIDGSNDLHYAYTVGKNFPGSGIARFVQYARGTFGNWTVEKPEGPYIEGAYLDLTTTEGGLPVVAFHEATQRDIKLAMRTDFNSWNGDVIAEEGDVGRFVDFPQRTMEAFTADVAYFDATHGKIVQRSGSHDNWDQATMIQSGFAVASLSYADSAGWGRVAYYDSLAGDLFLARLGPGATSIVAVDQTGDVGRSCQIGVTLDGVTHILYYDGSVGALKHARFSGGAWSQVTVASGLGVGRRCAMAVKRFELGAAYYNSLAGDLYWARWNGSSWSTGLIDAAGDVGSACSVALDVGSDINVSYYDATNGDLKFARVRDPGTVVDITLVDGDGNVGMANAIAVDPTDNLVKIVYTDADLGVMRFAQEVAVGSVDGPLAAASPLLRVEPNPTKPNAYVRISCSEPGVRRGRVAIFDVLGRIVATLEKASLGSEAPPILLRLPSVGPGMLFVQAVLEDGTQHTSRTAVIE